VCAVSFFIASVGSLVTIPSPAWMWAVGMGIHFPAYYLATSVGPHAHAHGIDLGTQLKMW
jgi:hypothetical protein